MVEWWWLIVEAVVLIGYAGVVRGWTWNEAAFYALSVPDLARQRLDKLPPYYHRSLERALRARLLKQGQQAVRRNTNVLRYLRHLKSRLP